MNATAEADPRRQPSAVASSGRRKVAILGGGCGGLAAAWELTQPRQHNRFEVTVYQLGWRLGGKGASGRTPFGPGQPPDAAGSRIEEHGLHLWFGFYRRAFTMLAEAYHEAGLGVDWWEGAFEKQPTFSLYDSAIERPRTLRLPTLDGGPPMGGARTRFARVLAQAIRLLADGVRAALRQPPSAVLADLERDVSKLNALAEDHHAVPLPDDWVPVSDGTAAWIVTPRGRRMSEAAQEVAGRTRDAVASAADHLEALFRHVDDKAKLMGEIRFWADTAELMLTAFVGILADDVLVDGLGKLDGEDLRAWFRRHEADEHTCERAAVLRALYDLTFAYVDGEKSKPNLAAGKGLQALLMMLDYDVAFMWRMKAGMGDIVFAPLYLALKNRGVSFVFFSRITELAVDQKRALIEQITYQRQATVNAGTENYEPLKHVCGHQCWPSQPDWSQLHDPDETVDYERDTRTNNPHTLHRGQDFDDVVLAIPVGALQDLTTELWAASTQFEQTVKHAHTVATKSLQLWLQQRPSELAGLPGHHLVAPSTGAIEPFDTYCDMTHLIPAECYSPTGGPVGLAYFCAVLEQRRCRTPKVALREVEKQALEQVDGPMRLTWPNFSWNAVFDPRHRLDQDRLKTQYCRANCVGAERYVQTPSGSTEFRLRPGDSGFANLVLAGDWTHNVIDGGCVEAAVTSGVSAARSLHPLPAYVEYGALATPPGPLTCRPANLYCFWLRADATALATLLRRVFEQPTHGAWRYRAIFSQVILTFGLLENLASGFPGFAELGALNEAEAAIWIPTVAERRVYGDKTYRPDHLAVFMPYVFVDDAIALSAGREVYGFAKTAAEISAIGTPWPPTNPLPSAPDPLTVEVTGGNRGSGTNLSRQRLLTIRPRSSGTPVTSEVSEFSRLVHLYYGRFFAGVESATALAQAASPELALSLAALLAGDIRLVFLKQFRDARRGDLAALSQVVEARGTIKPRSLRWRELTEEYEVSIAPLDTHPLLDELGLPAVQSTPMSFAAQFEFGIEAGEIIWP